MSYSPSGTPFFRFNVTVKYSRVPPARTDCTSRQPGWRRRNDGIKLIASDFEFGIEERMVHGVVQIHPERTFAIDSQLIFGDIRLDGQIVAKIWTVHAKSRADTSPCMRSSDGDGNDCT